MVSITPLLTVAEVAEALQVSKGTVWAMIGSGQLTVHRLSPKIVRVRQQDLELFLSRTAAASEAGGPAAPAAAEPARPKILNRVQEKIVEALRGRALTQPELVKAVGADNMTVFRRDGLPDLEEAGLVKQHRTMGFYLVSDPPAELRPRPAPSSSALPADLTPLQQRIMQALDGRALKSGDLAKAVARRGLYGPDGLQSLTLRGLVVRNRRHGFFRPDAPPPGLRT